MDLGKSSSELGRALNSIKEWIGQLIEKDSKRDLYICLLLSTDLKLRLPVSFVEKQNKKGPQILRRRGHRRAPVILFSN